MKLLHIIPTYKPAYIYGGPIFSVSLLCENLVRAGHDVRVFSTTANGPVELDIRPGTTQVVDGVPVTYFHRFTKDHSHFSPALLWKVWRECRRFDAIHIHSWWNIPVIFSVLLCWLRGVRPVLSPRGMLSDFTFEKNHSSIKGLFHRTAGKFLLKKTRMHLTADSELTESQRVSDDGFVLPNFIQTVFTLDNFKVSSNGSPITNNPRGFGAGSSPFTIFFLSRIHPKKNLEALIEALSKVGFDYRLQIAGMGEEAYIQALKSLAAQTGISEKIEWLGELYDVQKFQKYAAADLFVLPSFNENFANVVIEALSVGTPVLLSEEVGLANYVKTNGLGWICGTSATEIAEKMEAIFQEKEKLATIRKTAPGIIERDFSPAELTEKYVREYKSPSLKKA